MEEGARQGPCESRTQIVGLRSRWRDREEPDSGWFWSGLDETWPRIKCGSEEEKGRGRLVGVGRCWLEKLVDVDFPL